ncbi:MAG: aerial mycelium formation protein [Actinobacteria bacterium]|nr:MAG: aerial mycelium formation protein [Actinomycetota bacterium]
MPQNKRRLDHILDAGYLADLRARSTDEVRSMRAETREEEALLSYERRMLHGRLAILTKELERRARGEDAGTLLELLPSILSGDEQRGPSRGSLPLNDPNLDFAHPHRRVTKLVSDDTIANLPSLDETEIRRIIGELEGAEHEVSAQRRPLLDVLDSLNEELARRYQTGEADPSDVLAGG